MSPSAPRSQKSQTKKTLTNNTPSTTFKKFLDAGKPGSRVLSKLERYVLTRPRDLSRSSTVLHPSEIIREDWCHRASYFLLQGAEPAPLPASRRGLKSHLVFQVGHAIHDVWQNLFADAGTLYGAWRCNQCRYTTSGVTNDPACPIHNRDTSWKYMEVPVSSSDLRISGRADGILVGYGEPLLLEIKSMSKGTFLFEDRDAWYAAEQDYDKAWKSFSAPFAKHIMQAQMYMKLLEGQPIAPTEALFIYHSKPDNEIKEFVVAKNDFGITEILKAAKYVVDSVVNQTPPPCNIKGSELCSKCEVY